MLSLREDFNKHKAENSKAINEAAIQWVMENVLLLSEGFNRESLQKLQAAISKFDSTFAPFGAKVPEVQKSLDDTVELMNRITMGEKITKKDGKLKLSKEESESIKEPATYVVKYLSVLYNNLSKFFNKDMVALLEFPLFRLAKENPTVALRDLADSDKMKRAILNALIPSKQTTEILKRMYRTMDLPSLDYGTIADQILNLSVDDFMQLMEMDKVPLVASADAITAQPATVTPAPIAPSVEEATGTNPKDDEVSTLNEEEQTLLNEIGEVNQQQLESISAGIQKIKTVIQAFPELTKTNQALNQLAGKAQTLISQGNILNTPEGKVIIATANSVYSYFDKLGELWPQYEKLLPDSGPLDPGALTNIEAFMKKAQGGLVARAVNFFKAKIAPGLSPDDIANEIVSVVKAGQTTGQTTGQAPTQGLGGVESLKNFFGRLAALKLQPNVLPTGQPQAANSAQAAPTTPTGQTTGSGTTAPTGQAAPAASTPQTQASAATPAQAQATPVAPTTKTLAAKMANIVGNIQNVDAFENQVQKLVSAGWKIQEP